MMALQLVDSTVEPTRRFWRRRWGFSDEVVSDPRPMKDILGSWPDWRPSEEERQPGYEKLRAARLKRDAARAAQQSETQKGGADVG